MMIRARPGTLASFCAIALALAVTGSEAANGTVHAVTIDGFAFHPPSITVKQGDTIVWRNTDPVPHTATAKDAGLDSSDIAANGSYRFTASKKGRYTYICTLHPIMKGELVVE
jgi:plastocyanin